MKLTVREDRRNEMKSQRKKKSGGDKQLVVFRERTNR